jgi:hypothetical protein
VSTGAGAAGAGAAAAGGDAGGQAQGGEGTQGQPTGLDPATITDTLAQLQGGQEELRQLFAQPPEWAQQLMQGQEGDGQQQQQEQNLDLSFLDDPMLDPRDQAAQLAAILQQQQEGSQQQMQQAIQEALAPVTERLNQREQQEAAAEFVAEFPEVGDPNVAKEVMQLSRDYAAQLGVPDMGNNMRFARLVFAAAKAFEQAAEEGSGDPGAAHLEGGGGAGPGGGQQEDAFDRALKQRRGGSVLPWG